MTNKTYRRWRVTAQSTWKKSVARIVAACARRNFRQVVSVRRLGAGGIFSVLRTRRIVDALTRWPSLSSSPWILLVSPVVILGGEPLDQRGDLGADRRPSHPVRVGPLAGDQAAVPAQDGAGGDQAMRPQPCWQEPDQCGEDCAVGPVEPGPGIGAAQHGDLLPQYAQLGVLGGR